MSKVVYSNAKAEDSDGSAQSSQQLPETDKSQVEFLKTKLKLAQQALKGTSSFHPGSEAQVAQLRKENEKLRLLNADYIRQLNQMAQDKYHKIEKVVVSQQFFEQKNIEVQLKDFVRKMTSNFSGLEKSHAKLIDHCRVMEHDIQYYRSRVAEADDIMENLNSVGKSNIAQLMEELRNLQNNVDYLSTELQKAHFDLAVKESECERKQQEIDECVQQYQSLVATLDDLKTRQNRLLSDHIEKSQQDAKLVTMAPISS